ETASGLPPERGLFTAIVGGFLISLLGGSRYQIGGPAGAFIVLVAAVLGRHGYDGLLLATAIAGLIMIGLGALRLGSYVRLVPHAVTVGFTAGIGLIILASQLKDLFGLTLAHEPAEFFPKMAALWHAAGTFNPAAFLVAGLTIAIILAIRRWRPTWPAFLIAIGIAGAVAYALHLNAATIGSRFGGIPGALPAPSFPEVTLAKVWRVLPDAIAIALLGAIESLLSAVVADKMSGRQHRSNIELIAQGTANIGAVVFGGMPVTGTIARTATNVRAGAESPLSGIWHAIFLLVFIMVAAPLAAYVPLAALAGLLAVAAWSMIEWHDMAHMMRDMPASAGVVAVTAGVTIVVDLLAGIAAGIALYAVLAFLG
ncbi:MAG: SulP family inorganic anion transporter, partial [Anaerolineae bacterium]|nr:SulP family inorganic anion transporter [Anaerolineae bacterium]